MGGKGRRRREKNYRAAHGGNSRLPPPPKPSSVDAIPSKLRKIMALTEGTKKSLLKGGTNQGEDGGESESNKRPRSEDNSDSKTVVIGKKHTGGNLEEQLWEHDNKVSQTCVHEKKKKKRKRKSVDDLRFEVTEEHSAAGSKRKERKKQRLQAKKKKHKNMASQEEVNFPGREQIKFGEVVEAPPKLDVVPKALKTIHDASQERLRLQAVEAYRNRKGWTSRPGIHLPPQVTASPSP